MHTVDVGAQQVGDSSRTTRDRVGAFLRNVSAGPIGQAATNPTTQAAGAAALGAGGLAAAAYASRKQSKDKAAAGRMAGDRVSFGAGAITGPAEERRAPEQVQIGRASDQGALMPQDLGAGYLNLSIPGSPLGEMGLLAANNLRRSQIVQDAVVADQHRQKDAMTISRGQLPLGAIPQAR